MQLVQLAQQQQQSPLLQLPPELLVAILKWLPLRQPDKPRLEHAP
jgi:hypothetical protein